MNRRLFVSEVEKILPLLDKTDEAAPFHVQHRYFEFDTNLEEITNFEAAVESAEVYGGSLVISVGEGDATRVYRVYIELYNVQVPRQWIHELERSIEEWLTSLTEDATT
jgi:hypothetical protein